MTSEYYGIKEQPMNYNYVIRNIEKYGNAYIHKNNFHKIKDKLDCLYDYTIKESGFGFIIEVKKDDIK